MSFSKIYINGKNKLNASKRFGHVATVYNDRYLIVFGGCNNIIDQREADNPIDSLWIFDTELELWRAYATKGDKPPRSSGACGFLNQNKYYLFGGFSNGCHLNDLYSLNLKTFEWKKLNGQSDHQVKRPSPRDKFSGWVLKNRIYYFGGFGPEPGIKYINFNGDFNTDPDFIQLDVPLGWNNQLLCFDIDTNTWQNPKFNGSMVPEPRAAHTCTYMSDNKVVLFGGRTLTSRTNDLFILDISSLTWSNNLSDLLNQKPPGRSWMTTVRLNDNELFVYGGFNGYLEALGDAWIINIHTLTCSQILCNRLEKRLWHTASVIEKTKEIYIFGGCYSNFTNDMPELPVHLLKISINPRSLKQKCIDLICSKFDQFESIIKLKKILPLDLRQHILAINTEMQ